MAGAALKLNRIMESLGTVARILSIGVLLFSQVGYVGNFSAQPSPCMLFASGGPFGRDRIPVSKVALLGGSSRQAEKVRPHRQGVLERQWTNYDERSYFRGESEKKVFRPICFLYY